MLTLLTATGARQEAWTICEKLMARQDYDGLARWIVVDDGPQPQRITFSRPGWTLEVIHPTPAWLAPMNTQARNLLAGLEIISDSEQVVIIEDDDYYAPGYLSTVASWLSEGHELVGENRSRYYNLTTGVFKPCGNERHASLCSTAVQGNGVAALRFAAQESAKFIDLSLWRSPNIKKKLFTTQHVLGVKGMPGRAGIGIGHRMTSGSRKQLADLIGLDAELYS